MKNWRKMLTQFSPQDADRYRANGWWRDDVLSDYVDRWERDRSDAAAVVDGGRTLSYSRLGELSRRIAAGLAGRGVGSGDVVMAQLPNWAHALVLAVACARIGAVYNGISPIFRTRDLEVMARIAEPKVIVGPAVFRGFDHATMLKDLMCRAGTVTGVVIVGDVTAGSLSWQDLAQSRTGASFERPHPDDVAELAFTSGTTGEPKGVLHTHNTALAATHAFVERFGLGPSDVFHMASTVGHQTGFLYGLLLPIVTGGTVVLQDVWSPAEFVRLAGLHGITMTNGAIPYLADILRESWKSEQLKSLRLFGCFGAGLPTPLIERLRERLPGCRLFGGWGMTETGLAVTNLATDSLAQLAESDGVPVPGTELRVMDPGLTHEQPVGTEGLLVTRGPLRHLGFAQPDLAAAAFTGDNWYVTGDAARLHPDGRLEMTGRIKDIIVRGGENIPVPEVESLLLQHPAVRSVALVAVPDERLGERACACLILEDSASLDLEGVREWCREHELTTQFWPEFVEIRTEFPTTPSGKIQKYVLRSELKGAGHG